MGREEELGRHIIRDAIVWVRREASCNLRAMATAGAGREGGRRRRAAAGGGAYRLSVDSKCARPTSTVLPLARSSSLVSMMKARNQLSRFFSLASFSYFSIVRWSTCEGGGVTARGERTGESTWWEA